MKRRNIRHILKRKPKLSKLTALKEGEQFQGQVPRITNETVAEHRERVIKSARKYILPLPHSKHRIVLISSAIFIATIVAFFTYFTFALYKFQSSSTFVYRVTQVIPFPIARTGHAFVAYENYLFELRHYTHYYQNQLKTDFNDPKNKPQLTEFKKRALNRVVNNVYVKQLAKQNKVSVSGKEVDDQITLVRNQNRLGSNDKVFEDVLREYWGWSTDDFKRSLREELLAQKVAAKLDTATQDKAKAALTELIGGADFAATAKKYSDDQATKANGGEFGYPIDRTSRDLTAQTTEALFRLRPGQTSDLINVGYGLEIVKNIETQGDKIRAAHMIFTFKDISNTLNDLKDKQKTRVYISVPK